MKVRIRPEEGEDLEANNTFPYFGEKALTLDH